ncbi:YqaI family protein [Bacillus gobiensis]|uniref:YqaI family protein n=1 Tax=Bacillus gobiensis TaxID=1441095 RepID=UPI003D227BAD
MNIEHPDITRVNRTGYTDMFAQEEHRGIDFFGNEIVAGEDVVIDEDGEMVMKDDLEKFLAEKYGFKFQTL